MKRPCMILFSVILGMTLQTSYGFLDGLLGSGGTKTEDSDAEKNLGLGEYTGLKHAVGVAKFENSSGFFSSLSLGRNLGVMLESSLMDSGRFVVLERGNLGAVLSEQDLQASGRAAGGSKVAQTGKIRSAKYLISGAVTQAEHNTSGQSGGFSIKGIRLGASGGKATITAIVKVVDTTTGEILHKKSITGKAGKRGLKVGYYGANLGGLRGDIGAFNKTPLGEAAQDVIDEAVKFISTAMEDYSLEASVVSVTGQGEIIMNRGEQYGVAVGQKFVVASPGEELIDPDTGEVLDKTEGRVVCEIEVTKTKEKIAYGKLVMGESPNRGDTVTAK
ncbi:MAG: curli biogenesis system outer membrane secretion channel CsgG [Kiritimatiellia bacterium]|jgi:curli biogenesis system outer membrane secretion channel CsgG